MSTREKLKWHLVKRKDPAQVYCGRKPGVGNFRQTESRLWFFSQPEDKQCRRCTLVARMLAKRDE